MGSIPLWLHECYFSQRNYTLLPKNACWGSSFRRPAWPLSHRPSILPGFLTFPGAYSEEYLSQRMSCRTGFSGQNVWTLLILLCPLKPWEVLQWNKACVILLSLAFAKLTWPQNPFIGGAAHLQSTPPMMVKFMCQWGWDIVPRYLIKHYSVYFCENNFGWDLCLNQWILNVKQMALPNVMGLISSVEGLHKTKRLTSPQQEGILQQTSPATSALPNLQPTGPLCRFETCQPL